MITYKSALVLLKIPLIHRLLSFPCGFTWDILLRLRDNSLILSAQVLVARKQVLLMSDILRVVYNRTNTDELGLLLVVLL